MGLYEARLLSVVPHLDLKRPRLLRVLAHMLIPSLVGGALQHQTFGLDSKGGNHSASLCCCLRGFGADAVVALCVGEPSQRAAACKIRVWEEGASGLQRLTHSAAATKRLLSPAPRLLQRAAPLPPSSKGRTLAAAA